MVNVTVPSLSGMANADTERLMCFCNYTRRTVVSSPCPSEVHVAFKLRVAVLWLYIAEQFHGLIRRSACNRWKHAGITRGTKQRKIIVWEVCHARIIVRHGVISRVDSLPWGAEVVFSHQRRHFGDRRIPRLRLKRMRGRSWQSAIEVPVIVDINVQWVQRSDVGCRSRCMRWCQRGVEITLVVAMCWIEGNISISRCRTDCNIC